MPVLGSIRERFASERPLADVRVGACLHVTAETAVLVETLEAGGASVALCSANPLTVQADVVGAIGAHAERGESAPQLDAVLATRLRSARSTTALAPGSRRSTASCVPRTCCWPGRRWSCSATARPGAGSRC